MGYTKIHAIKATVDKAVSYICNPAKTDESILISSYACSPQTAAYDFKFALSKTNQSDTNKAFHLIQAFAPGEVGYEDAHRIGMELADRLLGSKYSYIVATHIDKGHIHNHIIFCAADNIEHKKYHDCKKSYYNIRNISDDLCREHGLYVIPKSTKSGQSYTEWQNSQNQTSWKTKLKSDIDDAIHTASTYEECIELIWTKGHEVKGEAFSDNSLKYISFRPLDKERFIRGNAKSLGIEYTKERIRECVENKALEQTKSPAPFPIRRKKLAKDYSSQKLIDTSDAKFEHSPGLKHWATIQNLKITAAIYSEADSITDLKQQLSSKSVIAKTARSSLVETEHQLKELGQIIKYAEQYQSNRIYHIRYQKSKDKDAYLRHHETELLLYGGAENMLKQLGINPKSLNIDAVRNEYNALFSKKVALQQTYKSAEKEAKAIRLKIDNLKQYLGQDYVPEQPTAKETDRNKKSL